MTNTIFRRRHAGGIAAVAVLASLTCTPGLAGAATVAQPVTAAAGPTHYTAVPGTAVILDDPFVGDPDGEVVGSTAPTGQTWLPYQADVPEDVMSPLIAESGAGARFPRALPSGPNPGMSTDLGPNLDVVTTTVRYTPTSSGSQLRLNVVGDGDATGDSRLVATFDNGMVMWSTQTFDENGQNGDTNGGSYPYLAGSLGPGVEAVAVTEYTRSTGVLKVWMNGQPASPASGWTLSETSRARLADVTTMGLLGSISGGHPDIFTAQQVTVTEPDTDGDGLGDSVEKTRGTDPTLTDTDGDGVSDGDEHTYGTDPLNPDTDGDGVNDGDEISAGTDPLAPPTTGTPDPDDQGSGGSGTNGGLSVTMPAPGIGTPGLSSPVGVTVDAPAERTVKIAWTAKNKACVFGDAAAANTTVTCDATLTTATPLTVTATDNTGAKVVVTGKIGFAKAARTVTAAFKANNTYATAIDLCPGSRALLSTRVVDVVTSKPVKGVAVAFTKAVGTGKPSSAGTARTDINGVATIARAVLPRSGAVYKSSTVKSGPYAVAAASGSTVFTQQAENCTASMTASVDDATAHAGQIVKVSGKVSGLFADGTTTVGMVGEKVSVYAMDPNAAKVKWTRAGSVTTDADGNYTLAYKAVKSVRLQARMLPRKGLTNTEALTSDEFSISVTDWDSVLTASAAPMVAPAEGETASPGAKWLVTGSLMQVDTGDDLVLPHAGVTVKVTYPVTGGKTKTANARVQADGTYTAAISPTTSGEVVVRYAATTGWASAEATTAVVVKETTSSVTGSLSTTEVTAGEAVTITGTVARADTGAGVKGALVTVTFPLANGKTGTAKATAKADGTYSAVIKPTASGDVVISYGGVTGIKGSSVTRAITVGQPTTQG